MLCSLIEWCELQAGAQRTPVEQEDRPLTIPVYVCLLRRTRCWKKFVQAFDLQSSRTVWPQFLSEVGLSLKPLTFSCPEAR